MKNASRETKLICLGDKLSNLRELDEDYANLGDAVWERFNQKDKEMHAWYYRELLKILEETGWQGAKACTMVSLSLFMVTDHKEHFYGKRL